MRRAFLMAVLAMLPCAARAQAVRKADGWSAEAAVAEAAARRGDWPEASRHAIAVVAAYLAGGAAWPVTDVIAAGRAYVVLGARDPQ